MNYYLLIGLEDFIDHIGCIRDRGIAFWKKANKKMQRGDIVYLFISDHEHDKIMYRLEVTDTDCERTDKQYWRQTFVPDMHCFVLTNTAAKFDGLRQNSTARVLDVMNLKLTASADMFNTSGSARSRPNG